MQKLGCALLQTGLTVDGAFSSSRPTRSALGAFKLERLPNADLTNLKVYVLCIGETLKLHAQLVKLKDLEAGLISACCEQVFAIPGATNLV